MDAKKNTIKVQLRFPPVKTDKPVISTLVRDYDLTINLLKAEIEPGKFGLAVLDVTGGSGDIERALSFLKNEGIVTRTFAETILQNENQCISCGACTAVCPSGALRIGAPDWKLVFTPNECLHCRQCAPACPMRAIDADMFK